jgi:caa(3)-type oxidase subunit IV
VPSVYSSGWSDTTKMLLLCILAITKAGMVAAFFMHLKYEHKWLRWIAYMPIYMGFAVIIIMLESVYR